VKGDTMKEIPLTKGKVAIVDDADYEYLSQFSWSYDNQGYAITALYRPKRMIRMHRMLMNPPRELQVDHINRNKLDNRKNNLRICSRAENRRNTPKNKNNTSGYKGVFYHGQMDKWRAQINYKGKSIYLGLFDSKHEAAKAYNKKAKELHGEFAYLNEIKEVIA
jgi:hypothetical protein